MSEQVWRADFDRVAEACEPYVVEIEGQTYLDPATPERLSRWHHGLTVVGFANGWL